MYSLRSRQEAAKTGASSCMRGNTLGPLDDEFARAPWPPRNSDQEDRPGQVWPTLRKQYCRERARVENVEAAGGTPQCGEIERARFLGISRPYLRVERTSPHAVSTRGVHF